MRRREFIALMGASVTWSFAAMARQPRRTYRLGALLPLTRDAPVNVAFLDEFRRRGFVEGQNLTVEWRAYGLQADLISQYAAELVQARVDVIVAGGEEAIRASQKATKTIPIVAITDDMLGFGFVNSVARPDGNTTGINLLVRELEGKRQDILSSGPSASNSRTLFTNPLLAYRLLFGASRVHKLRVLLRGSLRIEPAFGAAH